MTAVLHEDLGSELDWHDETPHHSRLFPGGDLKQAEDFTGIEVESDDAVTEKEQKYDA